jgi:hypothetical protein
METLPVIKDELEESVVRKFVGALAQFHSRQLQAPVKAEPWPDFRTGESGATVGIEVVEVLDDQHAKARARQEQYAGRIKELIGDTLHRLAGLATTLDDGYQVPPYPPLHTSAGRNLAESFAANLRAEVPSLEEVEAGQVFLRRWQHGAGQPTMGVFGSRLVSLESGRIPTIRFFGSFPQSLERAEALLGEAVFGKIKKNYSPFDGQLVLLAYELGSISVEGGSSPAVAQARTLLRDKPHPFDEVWYIYPYADRDTGHLVQIWPE